MHSQVETIDQIIDHACGSGGGARTTTLEKEKGGLLPKFIKVGRLNTLPTAELEVLDAAVFQGLDRKAMRAVVVLLMKERESTRPESDPLIEELRTLAAVAKLRAVRALESAATPFETPSVVKQAELSAARRVKGPDSACKARAAKKAKRAAS